MSGASGRARQHLAGEGPQAGEDLGEQAMSGRSCRISWPAWRTSLAGMLISRRRERGDHGLAAADAVACQEGLAG